MLNNLNNGMSLTDQTTAAGVFMNAVPDATRVADTGNNPSAVKFQTAAATIVVILGARTPEQATKVANGYTATANQRNPRGYHPYAEDGADALLSALFPGNMPSRSRLIIAAHSWGGPVGLCMMARINGVGIGGQGSLCGFGNPLPGDARLQAALANRDICRWMATGDNVCFLPPAPANAPAIGALLGPVYSLVQPQFQQFGYGVQIDATGQQTVTMFPGTSPTFTDLSLAAFVVANEAPTAIAHALTNYLTLIDLVFQNTASHGPDTGAPNGAGSQPPPQQNGPPGAGGAGAPVPVPVLPPSVRPPVPTGSPLPFKYEKVNFQHCVRHGDATLAVYGTRKAARDLAKSLNLSWKRWYRSVTGDSAALSDAVAEEFPS
jgi:hypothetical protein